MSNCNTLESTCTTPCFDNFKYANLRAVTGLVNLDCLPVTNIIRVAGQLAEQRLPLASATPAIPNPNPM